jgi:hypothetical protein
MAPEYLNVFKYVHEVSTRNTRQSSNTNLIYIAKAKTEYFKRSFLISSANSVEILDNVHL